MMETWKIPLGDSKSAEGTDEDISIGRCMWRI